MAMGRLDHLLKGLTPIPYKVVTITSGFAGHNLGLFLLFSIITRGARFFAPAFLLHRYGDRARHIIEKRLGLWVTSPAAVIIAGIVAALYLIKEGVPQISTHGHETGFDLSPESLAG